MKKDGSRNAPAHPPRRFSRIEVEGRILLRDSSGSVALEMFDISGGGLQVRAPHALTVGEQRALLASVAPGVILEVRATVIHCAPWASQSRKSRIGLRFSDDSITADNVATLIDRVTTVPAEDAVRVSA